MNQLTDFYHDDGKVVFEHIKQTAKLPEFVVNHRAMTDTELKKLSPNEFACSDKRMFPVSSAAETWTSIAYFNVLKSAALSMESAKEREGLRTMLAKAASLWGLDDEEVKKLSHDVTLCVPKTAAADPARPETASLFLKTAYNQPVAQRAETANMLLKAAGSELSIDVRTQLLKHAGAATCCVGDAIGVLDEIVPQIPFRSQYRPNLVGVREILLKRASTELMDPQDVTLLVDALETVTKQYHLKVAAADKLRNFTLADAEKIQAEVSDKVVLPGGIYAKKTAIAENAPRLSIHLSNLHGIEAHRPDEILTALKGLTPMDIIPFRPLLGA